MAWQGYVFALRGDRFPHKYIYADSYEVVPQRRQDLDPFVDENGDLHRNVVKHRRSTIKFSTPTMKWHNYRAMWDFIRGHYTNENEKKLRITYYDPETDSYLTGDFYVPDTTHNFYWALASGDVMMNPQDIEFIEY